MRLRWGTTSAWMIGIALVGCGYDWTVVPEEGATKGKTGSTSGAPAEGERPSDEESSGSCRKSSECGASEFCAFLDRQCGTGKPGRCVPRPSPRECTTTTPDAVCGCDGVTYPTQCEAAIAGTDPSITSSCKPIDGFFRCGHLMCSARTFCVETSASSDFSCEPWICEQKDCSCKETSLACPGASCEPSKAGGGTVVRCR